MASCEEILSRINQSSLDIDFDWDESVPVDVNGTMMYVYYSKKLKNHYVTTDNLCKDLFGMKSISVTSFCHPDRGGSMGLSYPDIVMTKFEVKDGKKKSRRVYLISTEGLKKMCFYYKSIFEDYADQKTAVYNAMVGLQKQAKNPQPDPIPAPPVVTEVPVKAAKIEVTVESVEPVENVYVPNIVQPVPVTEEEKQEESKEAIQAEDIQEYIQNIQDPIAQPMLEILHLYGQLNKEKAELQHTIDTLRTDITLLKSDNLALLNAGSQPTISMQEVYANTIVDIEKLKLFEDWRRHLRPILDSAMAIWCSSVHGTPNQNSETTQKRWNKVFTQFKIRNNGQGIYPPADWKGTKIEYLVGQGYGVILLAAMVDVFSKDNTMDCVVWSVKNYFKVHANTAIFYLNHVLNGFNIAIPYKGYKEE